MRVLGLSFSGHGSAICLVEDGRIVAATNLERLTRVKFALATLPPYEPALTALLKSEFGLDRTPPIADFYEVFPRMLESVSRRVGAGQGGDRPRGEDARQHPAHPREPAAIRGVLRLLRGHEDVLRPRASSVPRLPGVPLQPVRRRGDPDHRRPRREPRAARRTGDLDHPRRRASRPGRGALRGALAGLGRGHVRDRDLPPRLPRRAGGQHDGAGGVRHRPLLPRRPRGRVRPARRRHLQPSRSTDGGRAQLGRSNGRVLPAPRGRGTAHAGPLRPRLGHPEVHRGDRPPPRAGAPRADGPGSARDRRRRGVELRREREDPSRDPVSRALRDAQRQRSRAGGRRGPLRLPGRPRRRGAPPAGPRLPGANRVGGADRRRARARPRTSRFARARTSRANAPP